MRQIILALALLAALAAPASAAEPFPARITQGYSSHHRGIDLAAHRGTTVRSIGPGIVVFAGWRNNCGGRQVYVDMGGGWYATYNHLGRILTTEGAQLWTGTRLGKVGTTGCTTGPHVHLEIWHGYPWRHGSYRVRPNRWIWPAVPTTYRHAGRLTL